MNSNSSDILCQDASFGPAIQDPTCRGGFDFTGIIFRVNYIFPFANSLNLCSTLRGDRHVNPPFCLFPPNRAAADCAQPQGRHCREAIAASECETGASLPLPSSSPGRNTAHATIGGHPHLCGPPTRSFSPLVILFLVASHHIHRRRVLCLGPMRRSRFGSPLANTTPTEPAPFLFHNYLPSHLCIPGRRPRTDRMAHSEPNAGSRP
jgi:hypothetical protein